MKYSNPGQLFGNAVIVGHRDGIDAGDREIDKIIDIFENDPSVTLTQLKRAELVHRLLLCNDCKTQTEEICSRFLTLANSGYFNESEVEEFLLSSLGIGHDCPLSDRKVLFSAFKDAFSIGGPHERLNKILSERWMQNSNSKL